jgi:hypothetical protein
MVIDELEAFKRAADAANRHGWHWRPPFWIDLDKDEWQIQAASESVIRINATTGELHSEPELEPLAALSIAKSHAIAHGLPWKPGFSLQLEPGHWIVGARSSQLGGQVSILVNHEGKVVGSSINPK